jgi:hypothetical protein
MYPLWPAHFPYGGLLRLDAKVKPVHGFTFRQPPLARTTARQRSGSVSAWFLSNSPKAVSTVLLGQMLGVIGSTVEKLNFRSNTSPMKPADLIGLVWHQHKLTSHFSYQHKPEACGARNCFFAEGADAQPTVEASVPVIRVHVSIIIVLVADGSLLEYMRLSESLVFTV